MTGFISGLRDDFENQMEERMTSVLNNFFKQRIAKAILHNQISIDVTISDFLKALERGRIPIWLEGNDWWARGGIEKKRQGWVAPGKTKIYHMTRYAFQIPFKWKSFLNKNGIVVESDSLTLVEPMCIDIEVANDPILIFSWV